MVAVEGGAQGGGREVVGRRCARSGAVALGVTPAHLSLVRTTLPLTPQVFPPPPPPPPPHQWFCGLEGMVPKYIEKGDSGH